ncbi:MAG: hypothetical protein LAP40_15405 [Acidobacteriia bacterium]|nr:hypothetical protein [Terriglobia bacterium]
MKRRDFDLSALLAACLVSCLTGCQTQPPWHLQAHKEGGTVQICLSHEANCPQPGGVSLDNITVYRYDSLANNELVWDTGPENPITNDRIDGIVTYGVPPPHWHNQLTPPALVCGKAYLVNPPATLFGLKCDGTVVLVDFPDLEEFFRQEELAAAAKKRTD